MDYYDDDDGRDDFGVDSRASKLPTRQVDVAEEPEESQEVCICSITIVVTIRYHHHHKTRTFD